MKSYSSVLLLLSLLSCVCTNAADVNSLLPKPQEISVGTGSFRVTPDMKVSVRGVDAVDADRLMKAVQSFSPSASLTKANKDAALELVIDGVGDPEGYVIDVTPSGVSVKSPSAAGLFYGLQTLAQSMSADNELPVMSVTDAPRLAYRGLMLDISRHFRDADFIRKQIDAMAALKLNRLHLHLTDAAGWRIEIDSHPELNQIASWRPQAIWADWVKGGAKYCDASDPNASGGYLTKDEARDLVKYAADRYITIIPEIELPSHSEEVTAALPQLRCDTVCNSYPDLCVGNEETFEFLQDVIGEVMEIFPSEYIHIGGDEASKQAWKHCTKCQKRMADENLADVDELQSYMVTRMEKWINDHGRKIIGWDEILEGGLAPNATVMSWRGAEGGIKAAASNHDAIMTPGGYCYFDSYQDSPATEPEAFGGYLPLEKVYSYNPAPDSLGTAVTDHIIGIQGNIWAERIPTGEYMEYLLYPRLFAVAEIGWTDQDKRDYADFHPRAVKMADKMRSEGYNAFDLRNEIGNRPESKLPVKHLAAGKKVTYGLPWWSNYTAKGDVTLTDGERGGWNYNDGRWQAFLTHKDGTSFDVVVDLEETQPVGYVGADFIQVIGPGVWKPAKVVISVSEDGENYTEVATIDREQKETPGWIYEPYAWTAASDADKVNARYVRYQAFSDKGCMFTDEIIVK